MNDPERKKPPQFQMQQASVASSVKAESLHNEHRRAENAVAGLQALRDMFLHRANAVAASIWDYEASLPSESISNQDFAWRALHIRWNVLDSRSREAELFRRLVEKHRDFSMVLWGLVRCSPDTSSIADERETSTKIPGLQDQISQTYDADLHPVLLQVLNEYIDSEGCPNPFHLIETNLRPLRMLVEREVLEGIKTVAL